MFYAGPIHTGQALLSANISAAIQKQSFDEIIVDGDIDLDWCCAGIDKSYTRVGEVFQNQTVFYTVTGDKNGPPISILPIV